MLRDNILKFFKFGAFSLGLAAFLLLFGCANGRERPPASRPEPARPVFKPETFKSPFAASGLTARPDESAEEIVLRAQTRDVKAIALAVAGYLTGQGGFPRDEALAFGWEAELYLSGAPDAAALIGAFRTSREEASPEKAKAGLAYCADGRRSALAAPFRQGGLFDIEAWCASLEKGAPGRATAAAEPPADEARLRELIRALRERPTRKADKISLDAAVGSQAAEAYLFFAATNHDPEKDSPDWQAGRLFDFMLKRGESRAEPEDKIRDLAEQTLLEHFVYGSPEAAARNLELIRRAQDGDPGAISRLAVAHYGGGRGFIQSRLLAAAWLTRGVAAGSATCPLLLAVNFFENDPAQAWALASLAHERDRDDPEVASLASYIVKKSAAALDADGLQKAREHLRSLRSMTKQQAAPTRF